MKERASDAGGEPIRCGCPESRAGRHCPTCHGTGWILVGAAFELARRRCVSCSFLLDEVQAVLDGLRSERARELARRLRKARE
jgi:hypothetical protein